MKNKRFILIILGIILLISGCNKGMKEELGEGNFFKSEIAKEKAIEYMNRLQKGDMVGAKELLADELAAKVDVKSGGDMNILSFVPGMTTETGNSIYIEIYAVKSSEDAAKCDLDTYVFKVSMGEDKLYKIEEINCSNVKEVFVKGEELRVITEGTGSSEVILRLMDLPLEIFPKSDESQMNKSIVPKKKFENLGISYSGGKVALSTTDGKDTFIALAVLEEANVTMGKIYSKGELAEAPSIDDKVLKEVFEKPIAQKIVGYDILKDVEVKELFFTEEENELIVQYSKRGEDTLGLKIYKNPDGKPSEIDLEKIFPQDKYNVAYFDEVKSDIIIRVTKAKNATDISQHLLGQYILDMKKETIDKI